MPKSLPKMLAPVLLSANQRGFAAEALAVRAHRAARLLEKDDLLDQDDWRLQGQAFSQDEVLRFQRYAPQRPGSEHDHCEFCWTPFRTRQSEGPPVATEGFTTTDRRWICEPCYEDFKVVFDWRLMT